MHACFLFLLICNSSTALQETKRLLRGEFSEAWIAYATPEADQAWGMLSSPATVAQLGAVMKRLAGKKVASKM